MMQKEKQLVPKLRFLGFEGEWEIKEFKEAVDINPKSLELPNSFIYIDLESVKNGVLSKEERVLKKDAPSRAQRLLLKNDILYQTVRPYQKNNYYFDKLENDYVSSTGYAQIRTKNNSTFIFQYLHSNYFVNKVMLRCTGTSYPAINSTDLSKIKISIPQPKEQQKIANFLTAIDHQILTLEQKKTHLEHYKKGVLQKIFKQELRFRDDRGDAFAEWEVKKLGEVFKFKQGFQFAVNEQSKIKFQGSVEFIRIINVTSDKNDKRYVLDPGEVHHIDKDDLFMVRYGDAGRVVNNFSGIIANNMFRLLPKVEVNKLFFLQSLGRLYNKIHSLSGSSTMPAISFSAIENLKIKVPSLPEQTKIANFLSAIDKNIALVNTKIEHTKAYKKGLLQQMFV